MVNERIVASDEAQVAAIDRGLLFGDGVYEVIPAYAGHLFRIEQHLQRLQNSLDAIRLKNPHTPAEWSDILHGLIRN